jgi:hypothetical protein
LQAQLASGRCSLSKTPLIHCNAKSLDHLKSYSFPLPFDLNSHAQDLPTGILHPYLLML